MNLPCRATPSMGPPTSESGGGLKVLSTAMDPSSTSLTTRSTTRPARKSTRPWTSGSSGNRGSSPERLQPFAAHREDPVQSEPVGSPQHRHAGVVLSEQLVVGDGQTVAQHLLRRGELADQHCLDRFGVLLAELAVDGGVVLTVVADQEPAHPGELAQEPVQLVRLVLLAAAEPAGVGRAPVGQQQRTVWILVPPQEARERRGGVPGAGGQVE